MRISDLKKLRRRQRIWIAYTDTVCDCPFCEGCEEAVVLKYNVVNVDLHTNSIRVGLIADRELIASHWVHYSDAHLTKAKADKAIK